VRRAWKISSSLALFADEGNSSSRTCSSFHTFSTACCFYVWREGGGMRDEIKSTFARFLPAYQGVYAHRVQGSLSAVALLHGGQRAACDPPTCPRSSLSRVLVAGRCLPVRETLEESPVFLFLPEPRGAGTVVMVHGVAATSQAQSSACAHLYKRRHLVHWMTVLDGLDAVNWE
jgi:hypothetical protein